jgi:hypothetical protein
MALFNFIDRNILLPIADVAFDSTIQGRLKFFRDSDSLTREEIGIKTNIRFIKREDGEKVRSLTLIIILN